jgi:RNA polymerase sigma factor (sigma-70 family)
VASYKELRAHINQLPASERAILIQIYFNGYTEPMVAMELGLSERAVRKQKHKALRALRRRMR